ncbi:MAG: hypothetical protein WCO52_01395 [bacterium]
METYYDRVSENDPILPAPVVTLPTRRKVMRLSDRIELGVLVLQYLLIARMALLAAGFGSLAPASGFLNITGVVVRPLYAVFPSIVIGPYVLEPASAFLLVALSLVLAILTMVIDRIRMRRRVLSRTLIPHM